MPIIRLLVTSITVVDTDDGDADVPTASPTSTGYELSNNLDFEAAGSYASGSITTAWTAAGGGVGWVPIGDNSTNSDASRFTAIFEGNGHRISNLYINTSTILYVGLFGFVGSGGEIRNLGIEGGSVTGGGSVGGLAGYNNGGQISACYSTGSVEGGSGAYVGGLVGVNEEAAQISACYSTGSVEGGSGARVGGLVGRNNGGTISACYSTGSVTGTGSSALVGGLVGENSGSAAMISACYSTGSVEGGSGARVGGLVGINSVTGAMISACYSTGSVTGGKYVGGLVGINYESTISACYSTGSVEGGDDARVGGLVGRNYQGSITACYSTGSVRGGSGADIGGLVGYNDGGTITTSYFDATTSGLTVGIGNMTDPYVMGKTTAQLQYPRAYAGVDAATSGTAIYSAWNVDIDGVSGGDDPWHFGANNRYPKLKVNFDGMGAATAAEFGRQRFYFTDASDVEFFSFSVAEGTTSGSIGFAKALTGSPGFSLTDDNFLINSTTGEITVNSDADLDFEDETKNSFELAIVATVGSFSAHLRLNIEVTDVDEAPTITEVRNAAETTITSALRGDVVKIVGTNFSEIEANNTVTIGGATATLTSATATELVLTVPLGATLGTGTIQVSVTGLAGFGEFADFTVYLPDPTITRFEDSDGNEITSALRRDVVKIIGTNFSATASENTVTMGGATVTLTSVTSTELAITVPAEAPLGTGLIRVSVSDTETAVESSFTVNTSVTIPEDPTLTQNPGVVVRDIGSSAGDRLVTAYNTQGIGKWQYCSSSCTTSEASWMDLTTMISANNGLYFPAAYKIRFKPNMDANTGGVSVKPSISLRAWGGASSESFLDEVSTTSLPASISDITLKVPITPVNDAPTFASAPASNVITITEDDTNPSGHTAAAFSSLVGDVEDVDETAPANIYAITAIGTPASSGKWQYRSSSSASWTDLLTLSSNQFLRVGGSVELRFLPALNYNTSGVTNKPFLSVAALDATNTTANGDLGTIPTNRSSGTSSMSLYSLDRMIVVEVTAVNDAPIFQSTGASPAQIMVKTYHFEVAENVVTEVTFSKAVDDSGATITDVTAVSALDPDGGEVTYALSGSGSDKFSIDLASGVISTIGGGLNHEEDATYTLTLTVTDDDGLTLLDGSSTTITAAVEITVTDVSESPVFDAEGTYSFTVAENADFSKTVVAMDGDGDLVSYSMSATSPSAADGWFTVATGGQISSSANTINYEALSGTSGVITLTIEATAGGKMVTQDVMITVSDVDEAPEFASGTYAFNVAENAVFNQTVSAMDADGDLVSYRISATDPPAAGAGWFSIGSSSGEISSPANTINYEALSSTSGVITLTIEATAGGKMVTQDVMITVSDEDEAPAFYNDAAGGTTNEVSVYTVDIYPNARGAITTPLIYVADPEKETLTVSVSSQVNSDDAGVDYFELVDLLDDTGAGADNTDNFQLQVKSSVVPNIPAGIYTVTVSAVEAVGAGTAHTTDAMFTVAVDDRVPVFASGTYAFDVMENAVFNQTVSAMDADGDLVSYSLDSTSPPAADGWFTVATGGQISSSANTINYEALSGTSGVITLTIEATAGGKMVTQDVMITVSDEDEAPVFAPDTYSFTVAENAVFNQNVSVTDPDGDLPSYRISATDPPAAGAGWFSIGSSSGEISSPANTINYEALSSTSGVITLTIEATAGGVKVTQDVMITVSDEDETPVFAPDTYAFDVMENAVFNQTVSAMDADGDLVSYRMSATSPSAADGWFTVATDGQISSSANTINYEALSGTSGVITLTIEATAGGKMVTQDVMITVSDVDEAPEFASGTYAFNVAENAVFNQTVSAMDADGDLVSYSLDSTSPPAADGWFTVATGGQISSSANTINYEALSGTSGVITLTIEATAGGKMVTQDVMITVSDVDEAPVFAPDTYSFTVAENAVFNQNVSVTDPDGDLPSYRISATDPPAAGAGWFSIGSSSGEISSPVNTINYEALSGTSGVITLTVLATAGGKEATQVVTITVSDEDEAPVFYEDAAANTSTDAYTASITADQRGVITSPVIYAADPEGKTLSVSVSSQVDSDDAGVDYFELVDVADDSGTDAGKTDNFQLQVKSSVMTNIPAGRYAVTVSAVGPAPHTTDATFTVEVDDRAPVFVRGTYAFDVMENAVFDQTVEAMDADGDLVSYRLQSAFPTAAIGWFTVATGGQISSPANKINYEALTDDPREVRLTVLATAGGKEATQVVTITVSDVDEAPVFYNDAAANTPTDAYTVDIYPNARGAITSHVIYVADPEGETFTVSVSSQVDSDDAVVDYFARISDVAGGTGAFQLEITHTHNIPAGIYTVMVSAAENTAIGTDHTHSATVTVKVTDRAPVFTGTYAFTAVENAAFSETVSATDLDGDLLEYSLVTVPIEANGWFAINPNDGTITADANVIDYDVLPIADPRVITLTVTATPAGATARSKSATKDVTITVSDEDEAPVFYEDVAGTTSTPTYTASIETNASGELSAPVLYVSDAENESLTVSISSQTDPGGSGVSLFTIASYDDGEDATDAYKLSVSGVLSVGTYTVTVRATEPSSVGTDHTTDATVEITVAAPSADAAPVFYSDAAGATSTTTYTASIETNASGELSAPVLYVSDAENESLDVSISSQTDPGGSGVSLFTIASYDDGVSETHAYKLSVSGTLSVGTYTVMVSAVEAAGTAGTTAQTTDATVTITVTDPSATDSEPVFYSDAAATTSTSTYTASIETSASGDISDPVLYVSDEEMETLTLSIHSQVDGSSGAVTFFGIASFDDSNAATDSYRLSVTGASAGSYTVTVRATEAAGTGTDHTTDAVVTITVTDPSATDSEPVFYSDAAATTSTSTYTASIETSASGDISDPVLYVSDAEMETLTLSIHSQVDGSSGAVTFFGIASFDDSNAATDSYRLSVTGASAGSYTVTVRATEAAGTGTDHTTDAVVTIRVTGPGERGDEGLFFNIPHVDALEAPSVYPNPASHQLRFTHLSSTRSYTCKIYTLVGQQVLSTTVPGSYAVDVAHLSLGQYIVILRDEDGSEILRDKLLIK